MGTEHRKMPNGGDDAVRDPSETEPSPDDPIVAAEGALADGFGDMSLEGLRRDARGGSTGGGPARAVTPPDADALVAMLAGRPEA
jgi:hypothetical protein